MSIIGEYLANRDKTAPINVPQQETAAQPQQVADQESATASNVVTEQLQAPPIIQPSEIMQPNKKEQKADKDYLSAYKERGNLFDVIKEYNRPYDFEQELKQAERARKLGTLFDSLSLAGNALTSALGRRQFAAPISAAQGPASTIDRLKNARVNQLINSQNVLRDAAMRQYMMDRDDMRYDINQQRLERNFKADQAYKNAEFQRKLMSDEALNNYRQQNLAAKKIESDWRKRDADRRYDLSRSKAQHDKAYKDAMLQYKEQNGGSKSMDYIFGANKERVEFPKEMRNGVIGYLYKRMQDIASAEGNKGRKIDDINLQMGEGGDQLTKMEAIVKRRFSEYPELLDELKEIIGQVSLGGNQNVATEGAEDPSIEQYWRNRLGVANGVSPDNTSPPPANAWFDNYIKNMTKTQPIKGNKRINWNDSIPSSSSTKKLIGW